ncbi:hypothetical protein QQ056_03605 [Oscillatoria laete-virens NRMC-F 0139]|nr:hypothetical protein [Oscillatoria laete-virens]MDL5052647.1 hypothetical protein [Oscillatoria laete-virens NRMC-F 0139]
MEPKQLNLFDDGTPFPRTVRSDLSKAALLEWKQRIFDYQQTERSTPPPVQASLFDIAPAHCDPHTIDPFSLRLETIHFWRIPADSPGDACLYFVIDNAMPLLLYIGETCKSNQRWKGVHDCKTYIDRYIELHRRYKLDVAVCIAFWWNTPAQRQPRQALESSLIYKWRSPFNKQCWDLWGQPFRN